MDKYFGKIFATKKEIKKTSRVSVRVLALDSWKWNRFLEISSDLDLALIVIRQLGNNVNSQRPIFRYVLSTRISVHFANSSGLDSIKFHSSRSPIIKNC